MTDKRPASHVELVPVDEDVLDELVVVATADADPDDVTPPLGVGWTVERIAWLRRFHRDRRVELAGGDEETMAVRVDGRIVGSTRLHRFSPDDPDALECGLWLGRSARGQGLSHAVLDLVMARAVRASASRLIAHTTAGNAAALAALRHAGATLEHCRGDAVLAVIDLQERPHETAAMSAGRD
ncbi:GNAT family N-acetyltransferase [Lysobacter korlensis]|uniref:GNAT family N-acetyltransferase n=1 Tax=Lysobacter korlensis TaxID=553636 RepID=A0ABV6RTY8_9GAMM